MPLKNSKIPANYLQAAKGFYEGITAYSAGPKRASEDSLKPYLSTKINLLKGEIPNDF